MNDLINSIYSKEKVDSLLERYGQELKDNNLDGFLKKIDSDAEIYYQAWLDNYKKVHKPFWKIRFKKLLGFCKLVVFSFWNNTLDRFIFRRNISYPTFTIWTMLNQCNARCFFCHDGTPGVENNNYFNKKEPVPSEKVAWETLKNIKKNIPGIYFCGGEPLLFPGVERIIQKSGQSGMWPIFLNTNGFLIGQKLLNNEWETGNESLCSIDFLVISVHSLNPITDAKVFSTASGVYDTVNQLRYLYILKRLQKHLKFKLMTNTVIREDNLIDVEKILEWGEKNSIVMNFVPKFMGRTQRPTVFNNTEYIKLAKKILRKKTQGVKVYGDYIMMKKLLLGKSFVCFPTNRIHLKPNQDGHYDIPMPCSGKLKVTLHLKDIIDEKEIQVKINDKKVTINTKGKSWLDIFKELEKKGLRMNCSKASCYLAQDLSTELIYKPERMIWFGLTEAVYSLRRLIN